MDKSNYLVIMAGGVGSRFWPVSKQNFPKQFIDMLGTGKSLLQHTVERFQGLVPSENVYVATNNAYESLIHKQIPFLLDDQIVSEPEMRNTAPCILYSALKIYAKNKNAVMAVVPSDHWITDENLFCESIQSAFDYCSNNEVLLTFGIQPSHPHIGYGYIEVASEEAVFRKALNFTEKPDEKRARSFVDSGNYLWNSGIFVWSAAQIIDAFKKYLPDMYELFKQGQSVYNTADEVQFIQKNYGKAESISIDYGIMEKADNKVVLPVQFSWNDLGSWSSLHNEFSNNAEENVVNSKEKIISDSHGNIIQVSSGKKVVIHGLNDFIVVENDDLIFICKKSEEQEIKKIRQEVQKKFGDTFI